MVEVSAITSTEDGVSRVRPVATLNGWVGGRGMREWREQPAQGLELLDREGRRVAWSVIVF